MTETDNDKTPAEITVLRVIEGDALGADRVFAVTLSRCAGEDLGIVAAAVPTPGSPHPTMAGFVARPPEIFCVGLRAKDGGAMLATATNFYNVRVRYEQSPMLNAQCSMSKIPEGINDKEGSAT